MMKYEVKSRLSSVYWLGGSTCAGKTTIANNLSENYGLMVYHCDEYIGEHIKKSNAKEHPNLFKLTTLSWEDILNIPEEEYLVWIMNLFSEEFQMILEDLDRQIIEKPILVEGINLLPKLLKDIVGDGDNAIWLVTDDTFYSRHQMERKELFDRINKCINPEQALNNYMNLDLAYGNYIKNEAQRLDLKVKVIEDNNDILENIKTISNHLNLNL
jgi:2-phosphoglycerate kinase